ncbi:MAG: hypothetical protein M5U22_06270 [Thermoleophilia bacterium]|nr:hypothetical protein [Thermoleophilia bacterium]
MSGTIVRAEFSPGQEPVELDRIDGLDHEPSEEELDASQARYEAFLESRDFSGTGDLLPYFARDFFHDSSLDLQVHGSDMAVSFRAEAWVEAGDDQHDLLFNVRFEDVAWMSIEAVTGEYGQYEFAEIDALDDGIRAAEQRFGPAFHSLTVEASGGAWVCLVFRSVRVTPVDSIRWLRVLRDPKAELFALYGVDAAVSPAPAQSAEQAHAADKPPA